MYTGLVQDLAHNRDSIRADVDKWSKLTVHRATAWVEHRSGRYISRYVFWSSICNGKTTSFFLGTSEDFFSSITLWWWEAQTAKSQPGVLCIYPKPKSGKDGQERDLYTQNSQHHSGPDLTVPSVSNIYSRGGGLHSIDFMLLNKNQVKRHSSTDQNLRKQGKPPGKCLQFSAMEEPVGKRDVLLLKDNTSGFGK